MPNRRWLVWIPVGLYYIAITLASGLYGDDVAGMMTYPFDNFDKVVHFCEYSIFGMVIARALALDQYFSKFKRYWYVFGFALIGLAAGVDEVHQYFVPGREMTLLDWLADMSGASLGAFGYMAFLNAGRGRDDLQARDARGFGLLLAIFVFIAILAGNIFSSHSHFGKISPLIKPAIYLFQYGSLGFFLARFFTLRVGGLAWTSKDVSLAVLSWIIVLTAFQAANYLLLSHLISNSDMLMATLFQIVGYGFYFTGYRLAKKSFKSCSHN